ncbi:hypothetical protein [Heyndrickxia acidiproducens]|uniref:hypothetical protein n=1 Tax=Heyndrickxia acidiproducens TaxID=1121084 RepID=UPI00037CEDAD|nr:hypothetical protein [Heyndrickxia acidiproducens]
MSIETFQEQVEKKRQKLEKVKTETGQPPGLETEQFTSRVERHRKARQEKKIHIPLVNLLLAFFIFLPVAVFFLYSYLIHR